MPIPLIMADLSTVAASNSPAGSESTISTDDFHRAIQAILRHTNAKGLDIASAATIDLGAATGEFVDITGITTITSLGTVAAGIVRRVRFTGILTLTHNAASLILPSLASIVTANGDIAEFVSLGAGNWKCTNYIRQDGSALAVPDLSITTAKLADLSITTAKLVFDTGGFGYRNKIMGGDFTLNPWQRGTSFAAVADGAYGADRWQYGKAGTAVHTISKSVDAPTVVQAGIFSQHSLGLAVTTAQTTLAAGDSNIITQKLEGLNASSFGFGQVGTRNLTLSFWVKGAKTGVHCVALRNAAGNRSYIREYSIIAINTWEYKTLTIPVDTTGTWLYDNGIGVLVSFALAAGTTFQTAANTWTTGNFLATSNQVNELDAIGNNFKIALVQLEAGSTSTAFESRGVGQEMMLCQRYFEVGNYVWTAYQVAAAGFSVLIPYSVNKRATPTLTNNNTTTTNVSAAGIATSGVYGVTQTGSATATGVVVYVGSYTASAEL